jgi:hypothetical protein
MAIGILNRHPKVTKSSPLDIEGNMAASSKDGPQYPLGSCNREMVGGGLVVAGDKHFARFLLERFEPCSLRFTPK